ncbi:MAG: hypothetical protein JJE13_01825 [Thermoleophilia bacterium]|nr:hypothetical protein [Thermoleophilia bacterium]
MSGLAKLVIGSIAVFVLFCTLVLLFWARPSPILGFDAETLAHSLEKGQQCRKGPGGDWTCSIDGDGPPTWYRVDVGWDGCWEGNRFAGPVATFTPEEISGCIDLADHMRFEEAFN